MRRAGIDVRLKKALERTIAEGHPWIWRDALQPTRAAPGTVATVLDRTGKWVARGICDGGPIGVRVLTTIDEPVDERLLGRRIDQAAALRDLVAPPETDALRLLHGEGDRLPGFVCDLYGEHAVLALDGAGASAWRAEMVGLLEPRLRARGVRTLLVRSGRRGERATDVAFGRAPAGAIVVREHGMRLVADLARGQKTGLFLDQRQSRRRVRGIAQGRRVLDLYAYTGGFSVAAGLGGAARVTTVDSTAPAVDLARHAWEENGLDPARQEAVVADVPAFLGGLRRELYDLVVADPPSFASSERAVPAALESYRALHGAALARLAPGGLYLAASCSSHVRSDAFEATVREAARRSGRVLQIVDRWGAGPDHPRLAAFPEGDYLKVLLLRVVP